MFLAKHFGLSSTAKQLIAEKKSFFETLWFDSLSMNKSWFAIIVCYLFQIYELARSKGPISVQIKIDAYIWLGLFIWCSRQPGAAPSSRYFRRFLMDGQTKLRSIMKQKRQQNEKTFSLFAHLSTYIAVYCQECPNPSTSNTIKHLLIPLQLHSIVLHILYSKL